MSKTFDKKDVFTCLDIDEAKSYIGKEGYFADTLSGLREALRGERNYTLVCLENNESTFPFNDRAIDATIRKSYALFLPVNKVKEIHEKQYRPFKAMSEFASSLNIQVGTPIRYRAKNNNLLEHVVLISGFSETPEYELKYIFLGRLKFTPEELFDNYEWFFNDAWQPFGVLENE